MYYVCIMYTLITDRKRLGSIFLRPQRRDQAAQSSSQQSEPGATRLITVKLDGRRVEFESPFRDEEAIVALCALLATRRDMNDFASRLVRKANRGNRFSRTQLDWVHWFALNPND